MDPHAHSQGATPNHGDGHQLNGYFNDITNFANYAPPQDAEFDFNWENTLYQTPENASTYAQPGTTWPSNALNPSTEHNLHSFTPPQTSFHPSQFQQPQYENRPPSQTAFDPRSISQPSPSPGPYQGYPYQQRMPYPAHQYAPPQEYAHPPQQVAAPQARSQVSTPGFSPSPQPPPYMQYPMRPSPSQTLPPISSGSFGSFPAQEPRSAQNFVDPHLLTANNFSQPQQEQYQHDFNRMPEQKFPANVGSIGIDGQNKAILSAQQGVFIHSGRPNSMPVSAVLKPEKPPKAIKPKKDPNAPKRPRGRPRKDGTIKPVKAAASSSESDSELEIEDEVAESPPDLLLAAKPEDPERAAKYDTLAAVWSPRNKPATIDKIRHGIVIYAELVKGIRDKWKALNDELKKAELANAPTMALKHQVSQKRKLMEVVMGTTLTDGHPSHIAKLGENPYTVTVMYSFLADRVTASDFDGLLVAGILKVMSRFTTLHQGILPKVEKILPRFLKMGGPEVKSLAQAVLDNGIATSKRAAAGLSSPQSGSPAPIGPTKGSPIVLISNPPEVAGSKRPRDESASLPSTKKIATSKPIQQASKPLALQAAAARKLESTLNATKSSSASNGIAGLKAKPNPATTSAVKPTPSIFSSLASASKKPGTSNAARAAAAAKEKPGTSVATKTESPPPSAATVSAAPTSRTTFSFTQTLAGLNKPKEVEEKVVDEHPNETEEERAKRLRKEGRRKLRVTWKPDDELKEIRIFTHHPDEEVGHADSMTRDMDDVGGEGRMLKMHKDLDEIDDDEEARSTGEDLSSYSPPSEIEFEGIDEEDRGRNFVKRGGKLDPESPENAAQEHREQTSLMVVYALPSDVPPSPKEPPTSTEEDDYSPPTPFGEPGEDKIRARERQYFDSSTNTNGQPDLSAIFGALGSQPPAQQSKPLSNLEQTFKLFAQPQAQPQQQQAPIAGGLDLSKLLPVFQQLQQPAAAPTNLAAMLASLQNPAQHQQQQQTPNYNYLQQGNPNPYPGDDYTRKHGRDDEYPAGFEDNQYDESGRKKKPKGGSASASSDLKYHPKAKTVPCRFWKEGKCKKGDDCTYIHD